MRGLLVLLLCPLVLLTVTSCASHEGNGAGNESSSFSRAFDLRETRQGGQRQPMVPKGTLVDYESEIELRPDRSLLGESAGLLRTTRPSPEVVDIEKQIRDLAENLQEALRLVADYNAKYREAIAVSPNGRLVFNNRKWRELAGQQLKIIRAMKDPIERYVDQRDFQGKYLAWRAKDEMPSPEGPFTMDDVRGFTAAVNRLWEPISPIGDTYDVAAITAFLNEYSAFLRQRITDLEHALLKDMKDVGLQMEAELIRDGGHFPVTFSPYTNVEGSQRGAKSGRIGIPSAEDIERVSEAFDLNKGVADSINEISTRGAKANTEAFRNAILSALREALDSMTTAQSDLQSLAENKDPNLSDNIRWAAVHLCSELEGIRTDVEALIDSAPQSDPVTVITDVARITIRLQGLDDDWQTLKAAPAEFISPALHEFTAATVGALSTQSQDSSDGIGKLLVSLDALRDLARMNSLSELEPGEITRRPFGIAQAPPGVVNLADTPAEQGDTLVLRYKLTIDPCDVGARAQDANEPLEMQGARFLDIRKFGWYTSFNAQLLFYNRINDGVSSFKAAPGIGYNFHYRPEYWQGFFDIVAPGIGLCVSAPGFETGTELAVGGQITLFNNFVQAGYAYNLSVEDQPGMLFFGLDLIELFQKAYP